MTTTQNEPVEASEPPEGTSTPDQPSEPVEDGSKAANREAAKYRTRLREVEAERDTLAEQVTTLQRAEAERLAAAHLKNPAGLWAAGADLPALLADDGTVDPDKVAAAAKTAVEQVGLEPVRVGIVPRQGTGDPSARISENPMTEALLSRR